MIQKQQFLSLDSAIQINIATTPLKIKKNSLNSSYDSSNIKTIKVKLSDPVSTIFDSFRSPIKYSRLIFNGQILCPILSFAFYNIHNKDTIIITSFPNAPLATDLTSNIPLKDANNHHILVAAPKAISISHKRNLFYSRSLNRFKNALTNDNDDSKHIINENCIDNILKEKLPVTESARLSDIYRTQIESDSKSFRQLCSSYNSNPNYYPIKRIPTKMPPQQLESNSEIRSLETKIPSSSILSNF